MNVVLLGGEDPWASVDNRNVALMGGLFRDIGHGVASAGRSVAKNAGRTAKALSKGHVLTAAKAAGSTVGALPGAKTVAGKAIRYAVPGGAIALDAYGTAKKISKPVQKKPAAKKVAKKVAPAPKPVVQKKPIGKTAGAIQVALQKKPVGRVASQVKPGSPISAASTSAAKLPQMVAAAQPKSSINPLLLAVPAAALLLL